MHCLDKVDPTNLGDPHRRVAVEGQARSRGRLPRNARDPPRPSWCIMSPTAMSVAVNGPVLSSSVGLAFGSPMMMVGARRERQRYARLRACRKSLVSSPNVTCVSSTFSCHLGPEH